METQEEDSTLEEERFADALEEHMIVEEKEEKAEESKRDSKFEDDFEEVPQIVEIKEQAAMQDVVSLENSQSTKQETAEKDNNNETTQTPTQQQDEDTDSDKPVYPSQPVLILLVTGLCLSVLLVSLDRTIITTVWYPACPNP
jgi:beta-glucosidase-like glycosyl hydrolase